MPHEPLLTLLALRRRAVDQSRQAVATCIQAETASAQAIGTIDEAMRRERGIADRRAPDPADMDNFAAWMMRARTRRHAAVAALAAAEAQTARAREALASARAAADAVEQLLADRAAMQRARDAMREAHALDDIARARMTARSVSQAVD